MQLGKFSRVNSCKNSHLQTIAKYFAFPIDKPLVRAIVWHMKNNKTTAGQKIETLARIVRVGTKIVSGFAWETPCITFQLMDENTGLFTGQEVVWCSEKAAKAACSLRAGMDVALSGFCYGENLRRVQVSSGCSVFGIGE
jgi:hypothetical protein